MVDEELATSSYPHHGRTCTKGGYSGVSSCCPVGWSRSATPPASPLARHFFLFGSPPIPSSRRSVLLALSLFCGLIHIYIYILSIRWEICFCLATAPAGASGTGHWRCCATSKRNAPVASELEQQTNLFSIIMRTSSSTKSQKPRFPGQIPGTCGGST